MSFTNLDYVLTAFSSSFRSVDVRIVAAGLDGELMNVITSIFPRCESLEEISAAQQRIKEKLPKNTDRFQILLIHHPFDWIYEFFDRLEKGEITGRTAGWVKFRQFNPFELRIDPYLPSYLKETQEWKLVGSQASGDQEDRSNLWPVLASRSGAARLCGYKDVYELIREALGMADFSQGTTRDFVVGIPMPARIAKSSIENSSLKIQTKTISGLKDLQLNVSVDRASARTPYYETVWRKTETVSESPSNDNFCVITNSIDLTNLEPHDFIDVELIHRKVPTLSMDADRLRMPLQNPSEPFAKMLTEFCSVDLFRKRLLQPEHVKSAAGEFEDAIAWLLSLIGISVVQLKGDCQKLRTETSYEIGSIDMIAYRENEQILLIDCDTQIPDEKKMRSMTAVKDYFKFLQDEFRRPDIVCMIFTPRDCAGIPAIQDTVKIVDKQKITLILEKAIEGNTEEARKILSYW
jgi:hypothetical protein